MINEINEIWQNLGRISYNYEPKIISEVLPSGQTIPKLVVKAYPDKDKDFYNQLLFEEFEDKVYMIREKWENMQYDIEHGEVNPDIELEGDEKEAEIFGLSISNDDKIIGNVYIFWDSLASLLETSHDTAPILNSKGETKGHITYSLIPKAFDEKGDQLNLNHYENAISLLNKTLQVEFWIHEAKGLPDKYCNESVWIYNWIDEAGEKFETRRGEKSK